MALKLNFTLESVCLEAIKMNVWIHWPLIYNMHSYTNMFICIFVYVCIIDYNSTVYGLYEFTFP